VTLGEQIEVDSRTRLIVGRELDIAARQPDVCNVIVHRTGDTLVIVDSGLTSIVRDAIRAAAGELGPWSKLLLLTTHGHPDHVGNNDIVEELGAELDPADVQHYVSAYDANQYRDKGISYWTTNLGRVAGLVPGFDDPAAAARRLLDLFEPMVPITGNTRTYEELPLEHLAIGNQHLSGWTFADGAVHSQQTWSRPALAAQTPL
jgi:glyoxylase-like metal-dependent hydrolase (beta-lactamase superfamily II)